MFFPYWPTQSSANNMTITRKWLVLPHYWLLRSLPNNIGTKVVYTETKLGSNFHIKGKTKFDHKHDLVYYVKYPECQEDYIGDWRNR